MTIYTKILKIITNLVTVNHSVKVDNRLQVLVYPDFIFVKTFLNLK